MPRPRLPLFILLLTMSFWSALAGCAQDLQWDVLKHQIRSDYPTVRHISPDSLHRWLQTDTQPLLLDVREANEYAVSHLSGAFRIAPDSDDFSALSDVPRDTPIVAYCSVGYRSSALVVKLQDAGFTNVVNLEGSIFAWANDGKPLYRDTTAVEAVHPYNAVWGTLVQRRYHTYKPSSN